MLASDVFETTGLCEVQKSNPCTAAWSPIQLLSVTSVLNFSELVSHTSHPTLDILIYPECMHTMKLINLGYVQTKEFIYPGCIYIKELMYPGCINTRELMHPGCIFTWELIYPCCINTRELIYPGCIFRGS